MGLHIRKKIFFKSSYSILYWVLIRVLSNKSQAWQVTRVLDPSFQFRGPLSRDPRTMRVSQFLSLTLRVSDLGSQISLLRWVSSLGSRIPPRSLCLGSQFLDMPVKSSLGRHLFQSLPEVSVQIIQVSGNISAKTSLLSKTSFKNL